jgi:hypothetical protein
MRVNIHAVCCVLFAACGRLDFEGAQPFPPSHVGEVVATGPTALVLGDSTIDTDALAIDGAPPPAGVVFEPRGQLGGPELALLAVDALAVVEGATVRVVGTRPFVIVARREIDLAGVIDAGARGAVPGPGASDQGRGSDGASRQTNCDPGGGGGGHAQPGAASGAVCQQAGAPGLSHGDAAISVLVGGSSGGSGSPGACPVAARGAGGGAIQLTSYGRIRFAPTGGVTAGGGGGGGGPECGLNNAGGGSGGGAGGAIFIEARALAIDGETRVDGGGGGAGGNGQPQNGTIATGAPGADGAISGPGLGGISVARMGDCGGDGGIGGSAETAPSAGQNCTNGGGGGGAGGWIVVNEVPRSQ